MSQDDNALDDFSKDFPSDESQKKDTDFLNPTGEVTPAEIEEVEEQPRENREMRRLRAKYQAEREAGIQLAARLEALSEAQKFAQETRNSDVDDRLKLLYGDDENGRKAAQLTASLLEDTAKRARQEALQELQSARDAENNEVAVNEKFIDEQLESLEDEYNMDLTSNTPIARKTRSGLLDMVERLSAKDREGNIVEYADFNEVFDVYRQTMERSDNSRQKNLASRGMVRGGTTTEKVQNSAEVNYLKQIGII